MLFSFLPSNPFYDVVIVTSDNQSLYIHFKNLESNLTSFIEIPGYSFNNVLGSSSFYYDEKGEQVCLVLSKDGSDYFLLEFGVGTEAHFETTNFYHHEVYSELQDSLIVLKGIKFQRFKLEKAPGSNYKISHWGDKYKLTFSEDFFTSLLDIPITKVQTDSMYIQLSEYLSGELQQEFKPSEVYEIIHFFIRNSYYDQRLFSLGNLSFKGFLGARVVGKFDADNDGHNDFLILINGKRWLYDKLICFSKHKACILWEREFVYGATSEFNLVDIDQDSRPEIIFSTTAYCNEFPIDWLSKKETGKTYISYLYILNTDGKNKKINNITRGFHTDPGLFKILFEPIYSKNKILIGWLSNGEHIDRKLITYNYMKNRIDTLDISYNNLRGISKGEAGIMVLDNPPQKLCMTLLNKELNVIEYKERAVDDYYYLTNNHSLEIENKNFNYVHPFTIFNKDLDLLYSDTRNIDTESIRCIDNKMYYVLKEDNYYHLSSTEFNINRKLSGSFMLLVLFNLLLLIGYYLIKGLLKLPLEYAKGNYLILYRIFYRLYFWRLHGNISKIYELPKHFSLKEEFALKMLEDISDDYTLIFEKYLIFFRIKVYSFKTSDEYSIIQRIAHDLKNQVLSLKLIAAQYLSDVDLDINKLKKEFFESTTDISQAALKLSKFTHINRLFLESTNILTFLEKTVAIYANHKYFHLIESRFELSHNLLIKIDINLMKIAICNLIDNSLEEISENGFVKLIALEENETLMIEISNSIENEKPELEKFTEIGFTTKTKGSGIGIPISKRIIEKHNGNLIFNYEKKIFKAVIFLNKNGKKNG